MIVLWRRRGREPIVIVLSRVPCFPMAFVMRVGGRARGRRGRMMAGRVCVCRGLALFIVIMSVIRASWLLNGRSWSAIHRPRGALGRRAVCRPTRRVSLITWGRRPKIRCIWPCMGLWHRGRARPRVIHVFFNTKCGLRPWYRWLRHWKLGRCASVRTG